MPTLRVLLGMTIGALVATIGALFLGEYEFDEWLPIMAGALLGLIVAEIVVSIGRVRNLAIGLSTAAWSATAVVLAGSADANETSPIKWGAYVSAGLAAAAALARANGWRKETAEGDEPDVAPDAVEPEPTPRTEEAREPSRRDTAVREAPRRTSAPRRPQRPAVDPESAAAPDRARRPTRSGGRPPVVTSDPDSQWRRRDESSPAAPVRRSRPPSPDRRPRPQPLDVVEPPRITVSTRRRPRTDRDR